MAAPKKTPPEPRAKLAPMTRAEFLEWEIDRLDQAVATGPPGSIAYVQALRAMREVHAEIIQVREASATGPTADSMTLEEWAARIAEDARAASEPDLELYVIEWASRKGLVIGMADGLPSFTRAPRR